MKNSKRRKHSGKRQKPDETASHHSPRDRLWLYGNHAVEAALANPKRKKHRFVVTPSHNDLHLEGLDTEVLDRQDLDRLLPPGAVHQGMAVLVSPLPEADISEVIDNAGENSIVVILDQATDPQNIGAVLRSAAAFGADAVVVPDRHTPEATAVLAKAASGALDRVPFIRVTNLARTMKELKDTGYWCAGLVADGDRNLAEANLTGKTVLALGAEGTGLRRLTRETCDFLVRIPINDEMDSLNLSAAAAITLYELKRTTV